MSTYTCGFCGRQVPVETDAGHVNGECVHREVSPREREDEERRWEHEFGTVQDTDVDVQDRIRRGTDSAPVREDT